MVKNASIEKCLQKVHNTLWKERKQINCKYHKIEQEREKSHEEKEQNRQQGQDDYNYPTHLHASIVPEKGRTNGQKPDQDTPTHQMNGLKFNEDTGYLRKRLTSECESIFQRTDSP